MSRYQHPGEKAESRPRHRADGAAGLQPENPHPRSRRRQHTSGSGGSCVQMTHGLTAPWVEGRGTSRGAFRRRSPEAGGERNGTSIMLYGGGSQARDFTDVGGNARGTVPAGQMFGSKRRTLNVEQPTSNSEQSVGSPFLAPGPALTARVAVLNMILPMPRSWGDCQYV